MFSEIIWSRIYDATNNLVTLTDGRLTIVVAGDQREEECGQGSDQKSPERQAWDARDRGP